MHVDSCEFPINTNLLYLGQKIPKGLHVRVNFETGVTEAKILDDEEREVPNKNTQVLEIPHDEEDSKLMDTDALKNALKKIKGDDIDKPDEIKRIKDQFRSYDKLKEEMGNILSVNCVHFVLN